MATDPPAVTVLIGAYENERTVGRAVASILAQTERRLELVVIDDGSTDRSAAAARVAIGDDPRGRVVVLERNLGIARSLNQGIRAAAAPVSRAHRPSSATWRGLTSLQGGRAWDSRSRASWC